MKRSKPYRYKLNLTETKVNHDSKLKNNGTSLMKAYTIRIYDKKLLLDLELLNRDEKLKILEDESLMNHKHRSEDNKESMRLKNKKT